MNNPPKPEREEEMEEKPKKQKPPTWQSVTGVYEILPEEAPLWEKAYAVVKNAAQFYDFKRMETGIIENADLFTRAVGEDTDIVTKEMFFIRSRSHRWVLRPEGTAPIVRAYLQYGMSAWPQPVKLYYFGPMFRHEKPQAGRYRQMQQTGFEILGGEPDPIFDAQVMLVAFRILRDLGIKDAVTDVNSIGCRVCQPNIKRKLVAYYKTKESKVCPDCRTRISRNPFRLLDCKREECQEIKKEAPTILDSLCSACKTHFRDWLEYLDELKVPYRLNNSLVRGFDYYNRTVFEFFASGTKEESGLAVGGGGRYDYLMEMVGGRPAPGLGFAFGLERLVSVIKEKKNGGGRARRQHIFFIHVGDVAKKRSLGILEMLRKENIPVAASLGKDALGKQIVLADKEGIEIVLIFGQKEVYEESIIIKNLKTGIQETVLLRKMVEEVKRRIKNE